jgi:hypothetical protein
VKAIQELTQHIDGTIYNCYFTASDPIAAAQYNKKFTIATVGWNVLFNMGFMYTNL